LIAPGKYDGSKQTSGFDGVLGTLRDSAGDRVNNIQAADLNSCSVEIGGLRTSVAVAIDMGILTVDSSGHLRESGGVSMPDSALAKAYEDIPTEGGLIPEAPGPIVHPGIAKGIEAAREANPNFDADLLHAMSDIVEGRDAVEGNFKSASKLANNTGLKGTEEGLNLAENILTSMADSVTQALGSPEPLNWLLANATDRVKTSVFNRLLAGDRSVLREVAERYELDNRF
jgi:hypothetical protein